MDNTQERTQDTAAWLAGLIDSDGCFIRQHTASPVIAITNCDETTVKETEEAWSQMEIPFYTQRHDRGNVKWAVSYNTQVYGYANCGKAINRLLPYMRGKRKVAKLNLERFGLRDLNRGRPLCEEEKSILSELAVLNKRGLCDPQRLSAELKKEDFLQMIKSELAQNGQSVSEMDTPSTTDLAWFGGILDGDGHIGNFLDGKGHWSVRVLFSNSNPLIVGNGIWILERLRQPYWIETGRKKDPHHKTIYHVCVEGWKRCAKFLPVILPYLRGKKRQAEILRKVVDMRLSHWFREPYTAEETALLVQLRDLNKTGRR